MEWIQWSYLRVCLLQLYAYEYKCVTDLGPISLTGLLTPFAVHVHCHMIAYVSNVTVIDNVCCIQKDLGHQLLYYCWRPPRRSYDIRNMLFFISCDIEYSFSVTHVYLLFGVIYAMTCMYIMAIKLFEIEKKNCLCDGFKTHEYRLCQCKLWHFARWSRTINRKRVQVIRMTACFPNFHHFSEQCIMYIYMKDITKTKYLLYY